MMNALLMLSPILIGAAAALGIWWLERFTGHSGLFSVVAGVALLLVGVVQLFMRPGLMPVLFVVQGILFLGFYCSFRSGVSR
jgi:hypothetical protein